MVLRHLMTAVLCARALRRRGLAGLIAGLALAPSVASGQYMALTPPMPADTRPAAAPDARRAVPLQGRPAEHAATGTLPDQRTGSSRQRILRDICIGCDR